MKLHHLFEDELTPLQRWFAGSQAVDANGEPLKLYHGTSKDADFKSFKMPKNGVWFTTDPTARRITPQRTIVKLTDGIQAVPCRSTRRHA
jgi:hypothetical protein